MHQWCPLYRDFTVGGGEGGAQKQTRANKGEGGWGGGQNAGILSERTF